jgi:hypothetical protein
MSKSNGKHRAPARRFNDEEVELSLLALALCSGNTRRASAELRQHGLDVAHSTLHAWSHEQYPERYERIYKEQLPLVGQRAAQRFEELAERAAETQEQLINQTDGKLTEIPARDLPGAVRNMATAMGINHDKAALLRGKPTAIVQRGSDAAGLLRKWEAQGLAKVDKGFDAEATAEDLDPPASLPPAA